MYCKANFKSVAKCKKRLCTAVFALFKKNTRRVAWPVLQSRCKALSALSQNTLKNTKTGRKSVGFLILTQAPKCTRSHCFPPQKHPKNGFVMRFAGKNSFFQLRARDFSFYMNAYSMDAISRMIYWQGDPARGVNGNAVSFLQTMNAGLRRLHPTAMLIAEDSTNFPKVTAPVEYGGLGFDYKWDLGWMNDTLDYFKKTPEERRAQYHKLTFSMAYFPQEHYLLPLSHDEVVHGKAAIVQKMYGDYEQKFPQARALYLYMMAHPGKKLNFMGSELGHMREWDEARELDWMLLQYPIHDAFRHFTEELNRLYLSNDAFWQGEYDPARFQWLDCQADGTCLYAFLRRGGTHTVAAVFNFGDTPAPGYRLHMPFACRARVLLHTEWQRFGGALPEETPTVRSRAAREGHVLTLPVPAFSGLVLELDALDGSRLTGKPNQ